MENFKEAGQKKNERSEVGREIRNYHNGPSDIMQAETRQWKWGRRKSPDFERIVIGFLDIYWKDSWQLPNTH